MSREIYCQIEAPQLISGKRMRHTQCFSTLYTETEKQEKNMKKSHILLLFSGLLKNAKKYHSYSKHVSLTSYKTFFKL